MQGEAAAGASGAAQPPSGDGAAPTGAPPSLFGIAQQLLEDLRGALHARVHLFALEAQRAGLALVLMAIYGVVAALLLVTAWFCLWTLLVVIAVAVGVPLWAALLVVLLISLGVAWLLITMVRTEARHLLFPASVRQLGSGRHGGAAPAAASAAANAAMPAAGAAE